MRTSPVSSLQHPDRIRLPLSGVEKLFLEGERRGAGSGRLASIAILKGLLDAEALRDALCALQVRHPKLRSRMVAEPDTKMYLDVRAVDEPIPLLIQDVDSEEIPWREETLRHLSRSLDPQTEPLVYVVALRNPSRTKGVLILILHHAICDGISAMSALGDLLSYYEEAQQNGVIEGPVPLPLVSTVRAKPVGSLWSRLKMLIRIIDKMRITRRGEWTSLPEQVPTPDADPQWALWVLSEPETLALVKRCRKEKVSLEAALCGAAVRALTTCLPESHVRCRCMFPRNIRDRIECPTGPVTFRDLGCFIGNFAQIYAVDPQLSLWPQARVFHHDIDQFAAHGGPQMVFNLLRSVKNAKSVRALKRGTFHISNYGMSVLRNRYGNLQLEAYTVTVNRNEIGASMFIQATFLQKQLNLTLHGTHLSETFWEQIRDAFREEVKAAADRTT